MTGCVGRVQLILPDAAFACCVLQYLKCELECKLGLCVGAVAPVLPVREPLQLVSLVVNIIFVIFGHFAGVLCLA